MKKECKMREYVCVCERKVYTVSVDGDGSWYVPLCNKEGEKQKKL